MVATLLRRFKVSFPAGQDVSSVVDDMKDLVTAQQGNAGLCSHLEFIKLSRWRLDGLEINFFPR